MTATLLNATKSTQTYIFLWSHHKALSVSVKSLSLLMYFVLKEELSPTPDPLGRSAASSTIPSRDTDEIAHGK